MATNSSILAWRTPWTEEPGRLLSIGSHKVLYDWSDLAGRQAVLLINETIFSHLVMSDSVTACTVASIHAIH